MEILKNHNAKSEYEYKFTWYDKLTDNELKLALTNRENTNRLALNNGAIKKYRVGGGKWSTSYYDICVGFDIETTTYYIAGEPYSTMYCWQLSINDTVIMGHFHSEYIELFDRIKALIKPRKSQRILCGVHNLAYEFSFIRDHLNITESFLKEMRQPLTIEHDNFIVFIDTMAITQGSLKKLAETYTNTQKCAGDLDYSKMRFSDANGYTPLTDLELSYCHNDVLILAEFMRYYNDTYLVNGKRPMTATGILNEEIKEEFEAYCEEHKGHRENVRKGQPTEEEYNFLMRWVYRGGYVHGNMLYTGLELGRSNGHKIIGVDYTSSYPSVMLYRRYPTRMRKTGNIEAIEDVISYYEKDYASYFTITLYGLKNRLNHSIESKSKCIELEGARIDNGRVLSADKMTVAIDMLTLFNYMRFYTWDSYEIQNAYIGKMEYLKPYIIKPMLKYYERKNYLKSIGDEGQDYKTAKGRVNSFYGLTVKQKPVERVAYIDGAWVTEKATDYERQCDNACLSPFIGCWVSSWARFNLLQCVADLEERGVTCYYSDTDSIKMDDTPTAHAYIKEYNDKIKEMCADAKKRTGATDLIDGLGEFDLEFGEGTKNGVIERVKYLGAKRYIITTDKNVELQTIAGLPKGWLFKAVKDPKNCDYYKKDPFICFTDKMVATGCKLATKYKDTPFSHCVTDCNGVNYNVSELSCVSLVETNFSLSLDEAWAQFVNALQENDARIREIEGVRYYV